MARDILAETFDAVLFDMDGTLISSTASVERCWQRLTEEYALTSPAPDGFAFHGVPGRDILDMLMSDRTPADRESALARIVDLEVADTDDIEVLPGTVEALAALDGRAAIVTSCGQRLAGARMRAAALPVPVVVVTADDVTRGKPDPEPYLRGAELLGVDPARCLVVEDAPAGVDAGRAAGAATLGVRTTSAGGPDVSADLVVSDLASVRFELGADGVRVVRAD